MKKSLLWFLAFALLVPCGAAWGQTPAVKTGSEALGEYLVVFPPSSFVLAFREGARNGVFRALTATQKEYLRDRYGLEVLKVYESIGLTSGKGTYHVRSEAAAKDAAASKGLLERLRRDANLESVSPNRREDPAQPAKTS